MEGKFINRNVSFESNMDVMQSSIVTNARFDMSRMELQIVLVLVAAVQQDIRELFNIGNSLRDGAGNIIIPTPENDILVRFSLNDFPVDMAGNEMQLKNAAERLVAQPVEMKTEKGWSIEPFIAKAEYNKNGRYLELQVKPSIWVKLMDVKTGFTEYELNVAMNLKSKFSVRLYMMTKSNSGPREYSLDEIREQFKLKAKYSSSADILKKFRLAQKELDEKAPTTFRIEPKKKLGSKEITGFILVPVDNKQNRDPSLELKKMAHGRIDVGMVLDKEETKWLKEKFNFLPTELRANFETFNVAKKVYGDGLLDAMIEIYEYMIRNHITGKGYFINALNKNARKNGGELQGDLFEND